MGVFRGLFNLTFQAAKGALCLGSAYSLFGWLYTQEIRFRLGDCDRCLSIDEKKIMENEAIAPQLKEMSIWLNSVLAFYSRIWHFREFETQCRSIHANIVRTVLDNYEDHGIFKHEEEMTRQVKKGRFNPSLLTKIVHVKELNGQLTSLHSQELFQLIAQQRLMHTGAIIGLTQREKEKLNLIFNYLALGDRILFTSDERYWAHKWIQSELKKHEYDDTVFQLIFI